MNSMKKNLNKKVISFVIALMMIIPSMPMNSVRAEDDMLTIIEEQDTNITLESDIQEDSTIENSELDDTIDNPDEEIDNSDEPIEDIDEIIDDSDDTIEDLDEIIENLIEENDSLVPMMEIVLLSTPADGTYIADSGSFNLIGNSGNDHTNARYIWYQDGYIYVAITTANHSLDDSNNSLTINNIEVTEYDELPAGEPITIINSDVVNQAPWGKNAGTSYFWMIAAIEMDEIPDELLITLDVPGGFKIENISYTVEGALNVYHEFPPDEPELDTEQSVGSNHIAGLSKDKSPYEAEPITNGDYIYAGVSIYIDDNLIVSKNAGEVYNDNFEAGNISIDGDGKVTITLTENYGKEINIYYLYFIPVQLIITANSDTKEYNGSMQQVTGYQSAGLLPGHVLSGITASGSGTNVGNYPVTFSGTPVIMDGLENVTGKYDITLVPGELTITPKPVTFLGESDSKVYNGEIQTINGITPTGLLGGHSFSGLTYSASGKNVGEYNGVFAGVVKIMDGMTDVTGNYDITKTPGKLTITAAQIPVSVTANSDIKVYTGFEQTVTGYSDPVGLLKGHVLSGINASGKGTNVGNYPVEFAGTPVIMDGDVDVSENYVVTLIPGNLEITAAQLEVTVTANSDTKVYNGSEQEVTGYSDPVGLLEGHVLSGITASGSGTNAGNYPVTFTGTPVIMDGEVDVTANYLVTLIPGNLEITKKDLTITAESENFVYDGNSHSNSGYNVYGLVGSDDLTATVEGTIKYPVESPVINMVTEHMFTSGDPDNYTVSYNHGTLTMDKANIEITVTANSQSKVYDGEALTNSGYTYFGTLATGDSLLVTVVGTITNVGTEINEITEVKVMNDEMDVTDNYIITEVDGELTINLKEVTVKADNKTKTRGSSDPVLTATVTGLVEGEAESLISYSLSRASGESVGTYPITPMGEPIQGNYSVIFEAGTLTIRSPGGGGGGPTVIPDPEPPLAELEKFDHFAYVIGYPEGDVRPMNNITREEVAMIFYRLLTDASRDQLLSDVNPFTDVESNRWSNRAISTLYNADIISGYPDGTFKPSDPISRAEFATIAAKFDDLDLGNSSKFSDIFGHWAEKYITSAENKGWINGYPDMTFKPEQDITRAEAMTLINNVLERSVPEENIHPDAIFWPDNPSTEWYFEAIMEATNSHDYVIEEDGDELWTGMKPNKVWP
jgi:hypothetical protein